MDSKNKKNMPLEIQLWWKLPRNVKNNYWIYIAYFFLNIHFSDIFIIIFCSNNSPKTTHQMQIVTQMNKNINSSPETFSTIWHTPTTEVPEVQISVFFQ